MTLGDDAIWTNGALLSAALDDEQRQQLKESLKLALISLTPSQFEALERGVCEAIKAFQASAPDLDLWTSQSRHNNTSEYMRA